MNLSVKLGIALIPLIFFAAWVLYGGGGTLQPAGISTFVREGELHTDDPGSVAGVWYLSYEEPGMSAQSQPLLFDHDSRCGIEGDFRICNISFERGERVRIEGVYAGDAVLVQHLIYLR